MPSRNDGSVGKNLVGGGCGCRVDGDSGDREGVGCAEEMLVRGETAAVLVVVGTRGCSLGWLASGTVAAHSHGDAASATSRDAR